MMSVSWTDKLKKRWLTIQQIVQPPPPQVIKHIKTTTYVVGNPGPCLELAKTCGGVKSVNGFPYLKIRFSNGHTNIYSDDQTWIDLFPWL